MVLFIHLKRHTSHYIILLLYNTIDNTVHESFERAVTCQCVTGQRCLFLFILPKMFIRFLVKRLLARFLFLKPFNTALYPIFVPRKFFGIISLGLKKKSTVRFPMATACCNKLSTTEGRCITVVFSTCCEQYIS